MTPKFVQRETLSLVARAVNTMLQAHGESYRVLAEDVTITRRGNHVIIALRQAHAESRPGVRP